MNRPRRLAVLMSSAAVFTFLFVLMVTTTSVSARRCQEECDAEHDAGLAACDESYPGVSLCYQQVFQDYESCSMNATSCSQQYQCYSSYSCYDGGQGYEFCYLDNGYCWPV